MAFMDDITILSPELEAAKMLLKQLEELIKWSRMEFKPKKSRTLSMKKGKVKEVHFVVAGDRIPTLNEQPVRSLGRWCAQP